MNWDTKYDRFLSVSAWISAFLYGVPALIMFILLNAFEATSSYVIPALFVYLVGAIAHLLSWGFQAVCVQIKISSDHIAESTTVTNHLNLEK